MHPRWLIGGAYESEYWQEIFDVRAALHAVISDISTQPFLGKSSDSWAIADRVT